MPRVLRFTQSCLLAGLLLLMVTGCDKLLALLPGSNMPGMVQGQCLDQDGHSYGFVSVVLQDAASGKDEYTLPAESSGNFLFQSVKPGRYHLLTFGVGNAAIPNDTQEISVGPGRTVMVNPTLGSAKVKAS